MADQTGPLDAVASRAAQGNQTPLYFWLEWLVCRQFGLTLFYPPCLQIAPGMLGGTAARVLYFAVASFPLPTFFCGLKIISVYVSL